jgi:hypothetical protein
VVAYSCILPISIRLLCWDTAAKAPQLFYQDGGKTHKDLQTLPRMTKFRSFYSHKSTFTVIFS